MEGAREAVAATKQSTKAVASDAMDQSLRYESLVSTLERYLDSMGLRDPGSRKSSEDCEAVPTPEPSELRYILDRTKDRVRMNNDRLEACMAIIETELT